MREPSRHGIRGSSLVRRGRGCLLALLALAGLAGVRDAGAQAITRYVRDTGNINFVTTGGSLRTQPNPATTGGTQACQLSGTSTQTLSGIPVGRTVRAAYLYWGGSGVTPDSSVSLDGFTVTASRTFTRTFVNGGTNYQFFGGFADVTNRVVGKGNGSYSFGNLNVSAGDPWCAVQAVVAGWSLVVIYESPAERLRAINVYDGLDYFYGSQLTLNPDGFRVPAANIDGRVAVFTLEGDPGNSNANNGIDEALRFNGFLLDDGINVAGSDPLIQQFDGTINTQGVATSYGIDVDQYDVSNRLSPGQTSATTVYSAGADLVLLVAQIVSATSDPAVDLGITKTHSGNFVVGQTGTYTLTVSNAAGLEREDNTVTVTDVLPAGLTFVSGTGTGWTCGNVGQTVTCAHPPILNAGASFPPITLLVNVTAAAAATVNNTATVSSPSFDLNAANNSATDATTIVRSNLSTSTKAVADLNGGEADAGDTLRYTITLTESASVAASGVSLLDDVPDNTTFAGFVSIPPGATNTYSPPPAGDGNGQISVSGISVPAGGSVTVVFEVTVANVSPGAAIDNVAVVTNPNGVGATPAAPQVRVSLSQIPGDGTKQLYVWSNSQRLSRARPTGTHTTLTINGNNLSQTFTLNPPLRTAVTLNPGNFTVNLRLARAGTTTGTGGTNRTVAVSLTNSALGTIASASQTFTNMSTTQTMYPFTLTAAAVTAPVGSTFALVVNNNSANNANRQIVLQPYNGASYSRVELNSASVINVDSIDTYTAGFPGGTLTDTFAPGATLFVRATVSDPFGAFDINGANISIIDPAGATRVNNQAMTAVQVAGIDCNSASSTLLATCTFQYQYTVPAAGPVGGWTIRIVAREGVEDAVTDLGVGNFIIAIPQPTITVLKTSTVLTAPHAGAPKRIPQAVVQYDITVTNSGPGAVDANTLVITDPIPADSAMYVATALGNPVLFVNGTPASGLTFVYATHVRYSSAGVGGPWNYVPVPDADGFDAAVRAVQIAPAGVMSAAGTGNPAFTLQFRVRIK